MATLRYRDPETGETRVRVLSGAEFSVGRTSRSDLSIPRPSLSRNHARIVSKDSKHILVDLKTTNGTFVNGRRLDAPAVLRDGDRVRFGAFLTTFHEAGEWYYGWEEAYYGPVARSTLEGWFESGQIDATCYVWRDGDDAWTPILEAHHEARARPRDSTAVRKGLPRDTGRSRSRRHHRLASAYQPDSDRCSPPALHALRALLPSPDDLQRLRRPHRGRP